MWPTLLVVAVVATGASSQYYMPPRSPCPDVFQYIEGNDRVWRGKVMALPPPQGKPMQLQVELYLEAALPTKYAGRILLVDDKDLVAQKILTGSKDLIKYMILFPLMYPLPHVGRVAANNNVMCEGPRVNSVIMTKISLEHTLYPTVVPLNSGTSNNKGNILPPHFFPGNQAEKPEITYPLPDWSDKPSQPPVPQPLPQPDLQSRPSSEVPFRPKPSPIVPPNYYETSTQGSQLERTADICGRPLAANELILHGKDAKRGSWPWITAIFVSGDIGNLEFQCSGTLFNRKHVITAGHCVKPRDEPAVEPNQLVVYLGLFNLQRLADVNIQPREVEEIFVHPEFGATTSFDADMAVLRLSIAADYTPYIRPICLWAGSRKLEAVVGMSGVVIGWGRDELGNKATNEPRLAEMPIVSQEDCLLSQRDFISITSNRTFCAGFRNDSGPCNGDSGSGMFLRFSDGNVPRYYLRGITSVSLYDRQQNRCDLKNYVVFTDTAKFGTWMSQFTKED